ncbi:MAG: ImuA family protein [Filomicrobium sp.]
MQEHGARGSDEALWFSGVVDADRQLQPGGLDREGTHEIKPVVPSCASQPAVSAAASAGALAFALQLVARRISRLGDAVAAQPILFCATLDIMREMGRVYGPGLNELGVAPQRLLIVETAKPAETLWAMEEGLKSQTLNAVIGCFQEVALTPARRLSLAAKAHATPCLLVTGARTPSAGAIASRWRVGGNAAEGGRCEAVLEKLRVRGAGWPASDGAVPCSFQRSAR